MIFHEVELKLFQKLLEASGANVDYDLVFPNTPYTAQADRSFVMPILLTSGHTDDSLDRVGHRQQKYVYQVDIYTPLMKGSIEANNIGRELSALFARDVLITTDNTKSNVRSVKPELNLREDQHWRFTFSVYLSTIY